MGKRFTILIIRLSISHPESVLPVFTGLDTYPVYGLKPQAGLLSSVHIAAGRELGLME